MNEKVISESPDAPHVRLIEKDGEKEWQIKSKEYGWERAQKFQVVMAINNCTEIHRWKDLGDPCALCGSDNCQICLGCGINSHD